MQIDTSRWGELELTEQIVEGNRNEVWRGTFNGSDVSVRRSRRSPESLEWEIDLIQHLVDEGFRVPAVIALEDGSRHLDGVVVQRWLPGRAPETSTDWMLVAATLQELHEVTADWPQRPGCLAVSDLNATSLSVDADMAKLPVDLADELLAVFATVAELDRSVIHGDPTASNIRIYENSMVGLLDFDESRVDVALHDLSNLGLQVLDDDEQELAERLSNAWETANGWVVEHEYALERLAALRG